MEKIQVKHVKALKNSGEAVTLINVLPKENFRKEHIPGSINIALSEEGDFIQRVESAVPSKNHKIIVYCANKECLASSKAAKALDHAGFSQVMDFKGGIQEWKDVGEPIEIGIKKARSTKVTF
jgi:rhodanese-related sulfurtransferase